MIKQDIKLTADSLVFGRTDKGFQILLIVRKNDPYKGMWCLPGGFVEDDEDLETAAKRELHEETNIKVEQMRQLHTFGAVDRDTRFRTVSVAYYTIVESKEHPDAKAGDDAGDLKWFYLKDLPPLGFDHKEMIEFALQAIDELQ